MKGWLIIQCALLKLTGIGLIFVDGWAVVGWGFFLCGDLLVLAHMLLPRTQGLCDVVTKFIPNGNQVWLTIDDGPDPADTPRILDLLDAHDAKATFFMIGKLAEQHPGLVRMVAERGHSIGNHTHTHPVHDFWLAGRRRVNAELDMALAAVGKAGCAPRFFRAPVGIKNIFLKRALHSRGLRCVAWSIRSGDGRSRDLQAVVDRVMRELRPGSIILMHEGRNVAENLRVTAIRRVLEGLRERGFTCVLPDDAALRPQPGMMAR